MLRQSVSSEHISRLAAVDQYGVLNLPPGTVELAEPRSASRCSVRAPLPEKEAEILPRLCIGASDTAIPNCDWFRHQRDRVLLPLPRCRRCPHSRAPVGIDGHLAFVVEGRVVARVPTVRLSAIKIDCAHGGAISIEWYPPQFPLLQRLHPRF